MTPAEVTAKLRQFNERCRDCQFEDKYRVMEAIDAAVEMIERTEKMESALEAVLNSGLLSGQYTIHAKTADLVCAALEESK